jgi:hypothetical protein
VLGYAMLQVLVLDAEWNDSWSWMLVRRSPDSTDSLALCRLPVDADLLGTAWSCAARFFPLHHVGGGGSHAVSNKCSHSLWSLLPQELVSRSLWTTAHPWTVSCCFVITLRWTGQCAVR